MPNPLYNVPGLAGYLASQEQNQAQGMNQLQQAQLVLGLRDAMQKRAREQEYQSAVAGLGPNPAPDALAQVVSRFNPEKGLDIRQRAEDQKAAREDRAMQFAQNLELRRQALDQQREAFLQRTEDVRAKQAFEESYKQQQLVLQQQQALFNNEMKKLGLEITKQGNELKLQRFDVADRDRRDKAVTSFANELQQNKIPALSASISTANDLLKQYEDRDVPGFGIVEGSKLVPSAVRSEESNRVRSAVQAVSNDLLNLYSGLAVTLPESERRELEEMRGGNFTSQDFKNAWPRIVNRYNSVVGNLKAGANAEVLNEYQSRPGAMKLDPLTPAFSAKKISGDAEYDALPSGAEFIGPDGKKRKKP